MEFKHEQGRIFTTDEHGKVIAEITFPDNCIDHTFVDDSLRGQGIAGKLVEMAVEDIEHSGGKVSATCSYAVKWLEKNK